MSTYVDFFFYIFSLSNGFMNPYSYQQDLVSNRAQTHRISAAPVNTVCGEVRRSGPAVRVTDARS